MTLLCDEGGCSTFAIGDEKDCWSGNALQKDKRGEVLDRIWRFVILMIGPLLGMDEAVLGMTRARRV